MSRLVALRRWMAPSVTLNRYLMRLYLVRFFALLVGLVAVLQVLDLLNTSDEIMAASDATTASLWRYVSLRLPQLIDRFAPFTALLATSLTLTGLSQHSEIVVMKAAGLSAHRVLFPLGAASAMIAGAHLLFSETVVADATAELDYWADQDYAADVAPPPDVTSKVWLVDNGTLVLVDAVSRVGNRLVLDKVSLFERNGEGLLYNLVKADFAWHQDGRWTLFDVRRFDLEQHTLSVDSSLPWDLGISPDRFQVLTVNPRHVGIVSLWRSIQRLASEGQAVGPLTASLYQKIAGPAATLLMPLLGALAGFGFQRARSLLLRAVLGMALGFAFFVVDNFMLAMGEFGVLPPVLAAFAPLVLFGCVGFAVLFYTED